MPRCTTVAHASACKLSSLSTERWLLLLLLLLLRSCKCDCCLRSCAAPFSGRTLAPDPPLLLLWLLLLPLLSKLNRASSSLTNPNGFSLSHLDGLTLTAPMLSEATNSDGGVGRRGAGPLPPQAVAKAASTRCEKASTTHTVHHRRLPCTCTSSSSRLFSAVEAAKAEVCTGSASASDAMLRAREMQLRRNHRHEDTSVCA
jgi:hypothetical protein